MSRPNAPDGYDLVVVADRLPIKIVDNGRGGTYRPVRVIGGPAALRPVVAARHGAWVGWTGHPDTQAHAVERDDLWLHPIALSRQEVDDYHRGQCASTLSPLYHNRVEPPIFRKRWRDAYREVNQRFAKATADIAAPGGVAWIHDYHLQLVPDQLRRRRPDLLIGFFLHQPFPPAELFLQLPTRTEIISGLLGADLVGFQQPQAAATFLDLANRLLGLPVNDGVVMAGGRRVAVGAFPVPIDAAEVQSLATDPHCRPRRPTSGPA